MRILNTQTDFSRAVARLLCKINDEIGTLESPIPVIIFGGAAVHLYTAHRVSHDLDVEFLARRVAFDRTASVLYQSDGAPQVLSFDAQYNPTFGPLQEGYVDRAEETGINAGASLRILVASPVDLAISKLGRFAQHDRDDIAALIEAGLIERDEFKALAEDAISVYIGNTLSLRNTLKACLDQMPWTDARHAKQRS